MTATLACRVSRFIVLSAVAMVAGCSTQPRPVRCDWRLEPINKPAPLEGPRENLSMSKEPVHRKEQQR